MKTQKTKINKKGNKIKRQLAAEGSPAMPTVGKKCLRYFEEYLAFLAVL
jgi:hypothetical protein